MNEARAIERPVLTMPQPEADLLRLAYQAAGVIVEYGSGGSTVLAGDMPGKVVFAVESDKAWAAGMAGWFAAHPPRAEVHLHPVDIGPTKDWGAPVTDRGWRRYHQYPLSVWDRADFRHPDVVLIDGRFRVACLLTVLYRITRPVVVLFDDYLRREAYHLVEQDVKPVAMVGRMARFELVPRAFPMDGLARFIDCFTRPN